MQIRIRNNIAWRSYKDIVIWRTFKSRGVKFKPYHPTEVNAALYDEIRNYIDANFGHKLTRVESKYIMDRGKSSAEEFLNFLDETEEEKSASQKV